MNIYKKGLVLSILLAVVVLWASAPVMAVDPTSNRMVITNATTGTATTAIPQSLIPGGKCRITFYSVTAANLPVGTTATEAVAAIYDTATTEGCVATVLETEIESNDSDTRERDFARGLRIANGACVVQGCFTVVEIEWERRP